jgi:hypothetical protein
MDAEVWVMDSFWTDIFNIICVFGLVSGVYQFGKLTEREKWMQKEIDALGRGQLAIAKGMVKEASDEPGD